MNRHTLSLLSTCLLLPLSSGHASGEWADISTEAGIWQTSVAGLKFADLSSDGHPDIVILPKSREPVAPVVYLHPGTNTAGSNPVFIEKIDTGLPALQTGDILVFADLDNDGHQDAIVGRYLDIYQDSYEPPADVPTRTAWMKGRGDGSFDAPFAIEAAQLATVRALAVGDVNEDGLPDLFFGNWYEKYFSGYEAFANDLLLQVDSVEDQLAFIRWPFPDETRISDYTDDLGGRPTYGVALPRLDEGLPMLLELNYGRRWNRLYQLQLRQPIRPPLRGDEPPPEFLLKDRRAQSHHILRHLKGENIAADVHVDGDAIRHGRHPRWPQAHANAQPRSLRSDEAPFRANGNTFDTAVGDIDNDGDFDLFLSTIIHAWAGESSDRSRFLVNQLKETGKLDFLTFEHLSVDRIPPLPEPGDALERVNTNYNQGDIFAEMADLNHDGRLDLIICSSDYPDPPPFDERLRIYFQQFDGRFRDVTADLGIDHVGAGMPSLADIDDDGDLDLLVGQSFNRLSAELRRAAGLTNGTLTPESPEDARPETRARLFRNESAENHKSIMLDLVGDPALGTTRDAYGTIIRLSADLDDDPETPDVEQLRQVLGPAGHAGKQHPLTVHFGLGNATKATLVEIIWSGNPDNPMRLESLSSGRYIIRQSDESIDQTR